MLIRLSILTLLTMFLKFNNALTINFDDSNPSISYTPITSWSISNDNNLSNNSGHSTTLSGSRVQFSFNGVQVTVLGTTTTDLIISLDGTTQDSISASTDSSTIFKISSLNPNLIHTLLIEKNNDQDELIIDEIKIAYPSDSGLIPALVPNQINVTPTTPPSSIAVVTVDVTSSTSSSTSAIILPTPDPNAYPSTTITSNQAGTIAGLTIGLIVGMIIIGFIIYWLILKRRAQLEANYIKDSETGTRSHSGTFTRPPPNISLIGGASVNGNVIATDRLSRELGRSSSGTRSGVEMEEVGGGVKNSWGRLVETSKFYNFDDHTDSSNESNTSESPQSDQLSKSENFPPSSEITRHSEDLPLPPLPLFTTPPRQTRNSYPIYGKSDSTSSPLSFPSTPSPIREPTTTLSYSTEDIPNDKNPSRLSATSLPTRSFHVPTSFNPATSKTIQEEPEDFNKPEPIRKDSISSSKNGTINSLRASVMNWDIPWVKKHSEGGIEEVKSEEQIEKEKEFGNSLKKKRKNKPSYTTQDDYYGHSFNVEDNDREFGDSGRDFIERNSLEDRY